MTLYRPNGDFGPVCDPFEEPTDFSLPILADPLVLAFPSPQRVLVDLEGQTVVNVPVWNDPGDYRPNGSMGPVCDPTSPYGPEDSIGESDPRVVDPQAPPEGGGPAYSGPTEPYRPLGDMGPVCDPFVPVNLNPEVVTPRQDLDGPAADDDDGETYPDPRVQDPKRPSSVPVSIVEPPDYRPDGPFGPVCDPTLDPLLTATAGDNAIGDGNPDDLNPDDIYPDIVNFPAALPNWTNLPDSPPTIGLPSTDEFEDGIDAPSVAGVAVSYIPFFDTSNINDIPASFSFDDPEPDKGDWNWSHYYFNGKFFEWDETDTFNGLTGAGLYGELIDAANNDVEIPDGDREVFQPDIYCEEPWGDQVLDPYTDTDGNVVYRQVRSFPRTYQVSHENFPEEFSQKSAWISQGICSFEGKTREAGDAAYFTSTITIPDTDTYKIRYKFFKRGEIFLDYFDPNKTTIELVSEAEGSASFSGDEYDVVSREIEAGEYDLTTFIENYAIGTPQSLWKDSPAACAIEVYQGDFSIVTGQIPCDVGIIESNIPGGASFDSNGNIIVTGQCRVQFDFSYDDNPDTYGTALGTVSYSALNISFTQDTQTSTGSARETRRVAQGTYQVSLSNANSAGFVLQNNNTEICFFDGDAQDCNALLRLTTLDSTSAGEGVTFTCGTVAEVELGLRYDDNPTTQGLCLSSVTWSGDEDITLVRDTNKESGSRTVRKDLLSGTYTMNLVDNAGGYLVQNPGTTQNDSYIVLYDGGGSDENGRLTCEQISATGSSVFSSFDSNGNLVITGTRGYTNDFIEGFKDDSSVWQQSDVGTEILFNATDSSKGMQVQIGIIPRNRYDGNNYTISTDWAVKQIINYGVGYSVDDTWNVSYTNSATGGTTSAKVKIFSTRKGRATVGNLVWSTTNNAVGYDESFTPFP
ncbi:hypothetical protein Sn110110_208 [Cyanophage S-RIM14]|uniref:Uncharacterized protein n=1 Tax=Cyanophage S-RIM14 TaxID=1278423 RepID=A0A1D7SL49_9CAUD|nr:hypothetical protein Sn110110_208 [Cyanophage S-RIM14]